MIAIANDHAGVEMKKAVIKYIEEKGLSYKDYGTATSESVSYAEYGRIAAKAVAEGECEKGILICGTGIGISIAANKIKGIRCAVCTDPYSALLSRKHNDSNMLALGARVIGDGMALAIVESWLNGVFEGGRHAERVAQISSIEND